mgnify:CR=1 FL=1
MRGINGYLLRRSRQGRRQFGKHILPMTLLRPAVIAVADRRRRAVLRRTVLPATTQLKHINDAADNPPRSPLVTPRFPGSLPDHGEDGVDDRRRHTHK